MRQTNLAAVDLNLLPALEALLRRRNVTRAAEDVGLSQPAMSRALQRLREALDDPLLVRAGGGLAPTPRALALLPELVAALDRLSSLYREPAFAPAELRRGFVIVGADVHTVLIAPSLLRRVSAEAPGVDLRFESYGRDLRERLEAGDVDFAFGIASTPLPPGTTSERLTDDRLALVMRAGHPDAGREWTLDDYARHAHVTISIRGDDESEIDSALAQGGHERRIVLRTPHFMAALAAVGASDAVTTVSATLARRFAREFGLVIKETPLAAIPLQLTLIGAASRAGDSGLRWLKNCICEAVADAYADQGEPKPDLSGAQLPQAKKLRASGSA